MIKNINIRCALYSMATLLSTAIVGIIIILAFPAGGFAASVLFILMNLLPMICAYIFSLLSGEESGLLSFLKHNFLQKEKPYTYLLCLAIAAVYYGVSVLLGNVLFTGASAAALLAYIPWTILQGGLEEVGWRWYLQTHLNVKNSFVLKMLVISVVWFLWHIPIYMLPWITSASSNYLVFYLMILGNTFTFGALKEATKGSLPCVLAHMLVDSLAVLMLVQSDIVKIAVLVVAEIVLSAAFVSLKKAREQ